MSAQYVEPAPGSALPPPRRQVTWYYRAAEIAVTNQFFHRGREKYAIAELTELGVVRGPAHPSVLISGVIAVAQAPIAVPVVAVFRSPVAFVLAAVLLVVPIVVAFVSAHRHPPVQQLLARYRGREMALFSTHDARAFGQVTRALQRAIEAQPVR
jgi:Family of unknown function (DUF6232)